MRPKPIPPRGVLYWHPEAPAPGYGRFWPDDELAPFVEHFWTVSWDLEEPQVHEVLPHPSVQLVFGTDRAEIAGPEPGRFVTRLEGRGRVLGTKFHPGGFRPFFGEPLTRLVGRSLAPWEVFGNDASRVHREALAQQDPQAGLAVIEAFLTAIRPAVDERANLARRIAARAASDQSMARAEQLAAAFDLSMRSLQRLFAEYVGVSPKWMVLRYRLHEALDRIVRGQVTHWADLALDLGYADQAHFIRDFRRMIGKTPAEYSRDVQTTPSPPRSEPRVP